MRFSLILATVFACTGTSHGVESGDALKEVNRVRTRQGLKPFKSDAKLGQAALAAAKFRAKRLIDGHTDNDFHFVPKGGRASAAGCAAWPRGDGWGSCCTYESWRYAGAAWAVGRDGKRYMHLFVR
jgi:hypothetical protein